MRKVSIIIPTKDRAQWLPMAVESALMQDYGNIEIIVTDNASTDHTSEIMRKYQQYGVTYIKREQNIGSAANMNQAIIENATGEYVLILCDDDHLADKSYISKTMNMVDTHGELTLIFANYREFDLNTKQITQQFVVPMPASIVDGRWLWLNYWSQGLFCPLLTTVFSRKIFLRVGGTFYDVVNGDAFLWLRMLLHGRVGFIPEVVANYGSHDNQHWDRIKYDIDTFCDDLDIIRVPAQYAIYQGMDRELVSSWKRRMMVTRLNQMIIRPCLSEAHKGNMQPFSRLFARMRQSGDMDYVNEAMVGLLLMASQSRNG